MFLFINKPDFCAPKFFLMNIRQINYTNRHLVVDLFDKYRIFYGQSSDKTLADTFLAERLQNGESIIFVATEEEEGSEQPAGFTQLYPTFSSVRAVKNWILNDLYVEERYRQQGVGEKLIRAAIAFARKEGATYVQLETAVDNHKAQRLYENLGFEKQEPDADYLLYRIEV